VKILFATAELAPLVSVGGLAEAATGLVTALRDAGVDVEVVLPDYGHYELVDETTATIDVPSWAGPATLRRGSIAAVGEVTLVDAPGIAKPHPYNDADGGAWPDNSDRFFRFSAAVASLAGRSSVDVLHVNDWHAAAALGLLTRDLPTVLTIHTLGYQGWTSGGWLDRITVRPDLFESYGGTNPLAGGIQLADRVVAVSPSYAAEIVTPEGGFGLDAHLAALGDRLVGIRNGIDVHRWDPATDPHIAVTYDADDPVGKDACRADLLREIGWPDDTRDPIVSMVTRLVDQKGVDLALESVRFSDGVPFRLALLGSGDRGLADWARWLVDQYPDRLWFHDGFDRFLAHRLFAGSDMLLMPSRFEPCGLAQMQAMEYGTIPIVTPVGGLNDTVVDADADPRAGNGFVSASVDAPGVVDVLHRAARGWRHPARRRAIRRRGMAGDWSWEAPAAAHVAVYRELVTDQL
jgi:starch synthase